VMWDMMSLVHVTVRQRWRKIRVSRGHGSCEASQGEKKTLQYGGIEYDARGRW